MVVNYYLVNFSFKFHEDPCTNERARVVNVRVFIASARVMARAHAFVHKFVQI